MELSTIWDLLKRRKWIIIQAALVVAAAAFAWSLAVKPVYTATSKILLMKAKRGVLDIGAIGSQLASVIQTTSDVDVNRVLASAKPILEKVAIRLQLRDQNGQIVVPSEPERLSLKDRFTPRSYISVSQYRDTDILSLKAYSTDPLEAATMANTLAKLMVDQNQQDMKSEYQNARIFLEKQVVTVRDKYDSLLKDLLAFQKREKSIDLDVETKLAAEKMVELLKEKEDNVIDLAQAQAKLSRLKEQLGKENPDFVSASALNESPQIEIIKKRLTELRLQIAEAQSELTQTHPHVQALQKQIDMAEAELKREIAVYQASAPELTQLDRQIASLKAHLVAVDGEIERYLDALGGIPDKVYQQASLNKEINVAREGYSTLLQFLHQLGIAEAATLAEIRTIEWAEVPRLPGSPGLSLTVAIGLFMGLLMGTGLALFLEYMDDTVRNTNDVKQFQPIGLIGAIPRFQPEEAILISTKDPNDPIYESYRTIRNYLSMNERRLPALLITSAGPKEGKSTTVVNLGICLAHEGKKVVIVDTDLRRPSLHGYFDLANDVGVKDFLSGSNDVDSILQETPVPGLSVVPSGSPYPDSGRLIESDRMAELVSELKRRFDVVILDSAPVLVKSDALILSKHVDGSIVVVESGKTTRRAIHEMLDAMAKTRTKPLGIVLNGLPIDKGKHVYQQLYGGHYDEQVFCSEMKG